MRHAADVPGTAVVLFDKHATLIEEGFGVRERGRPEPVTADSLYISRLTRSESCACAIAMAAWAAAHLPEHGAQLSRPRRGRRALRRRSRSRPTLPPPRPAPSCRWS